MSPKFGDQSWGTNPGGKGQCGGSRELGSELCIQEIPPWVPVGIPEVQTLEVDVECRHFWVGRGLLQENKERRHPSC